jgi:hypothetical protein
MFIPYAEQIYVEGEISKYCKRISYGCNFFGIKGKATKFMSLRAENQTQYLPITE